MLWDLKCESNEKTGRNPSRGKKENRRIWFISMQE